MLFIYILENIIFLILGVVFLKRKFNPITIFTLTWSLMVVLYNLKWVTYYNLTLETYGILMLNTFVFCLFILLGFCSNLSFSLIKKSDMGNKQISDKTFEIKFKNIILWLTLIGIIPGIVSLLDVIRIYGINFYTMISTIYAERVLEKVQIATIPYLTSLVFVAITFSGIFFSKYGFKKFMLFPIIAICIQPFTNGGRQFLIEGIILFILPLILKGRKKKKNKSKLIGPMLILLMIILLSVISNQRSEYISDVSYNSFATPQFAKIMMWVPGIYQFYTYFSSPVGVLNAFLSAPTYSFGTNSLFPVYGFLNLFGAGIHVERYQKFYDIPIQENAGTAVKELIEDYHLFFAMIIILVCGYIVGIVVRNYFRNRNSIQKTYIISMCYMIVFFSFYFWILRDASLIIALVVGGLIAHYLDNYTIIEDGEKDE